MPFPVNATQSSIVGSALQAEMQITAFKALLAVTVELYSQRTPFEFMNATPPLMAKLLTKVQLQHSMIDEN